MNITIFGATGAIAQITMKHALDAGHQVTAYVRKSGTIDNTKVKLVVGELTNQPLIEEAIKEADVVISALGPALDMSRELKGTPIADGHELIIQAMEKLQKKRFITLATPSIHSIQDKKQVTTVLPSIMAKILYPNAYREMLKIEKLIKKSKLDWTVVRIINPNVKYKGQGYAISNGSQSAKMNVSRENIGAFMYKVATEKIYVNEMPIVYNV
ncbi:NAD(P)H-binding protein [Viridibacillus arvi]|uniref:NAD(P)H-binding protein n=1 Tax=Viridibacillus arvi TaxID=263475 RepID=UPI003D078BF2